MNGSARHPDFPLEQFTATIVGESGAERGRVGTDPRRGVVRHLDTVRAHLNEAISSCADLESRGDLVEIDDRWRFTPHRLTEIDSLQRLKGHLDRIEARLLTTYFPPEGHGATDALRTLDLAMLGLAESLARRFEEPASRHDLQADLESGLRELERLLDAHNQLFSDAARPRHEPPHDPAGALPAAETKPSAPPAADSLQSPGAVSCALDEYRDVLTRVDRHIVNAAGDAPFQGFWRGVRQRYREEIDRLLRSAGEARLAYSMFES
jgi:hypothetical protein